MAWWTSALAFSLALAVLIGCDRPALLAGDDVATPQRADTPRLRRASIWIRFDNGRLDTGTGPPNEDRLTVSAVFGDADPHDAQVIDALAGQATVGNAGLPADSCEHLISAGQGLNPAGVARPRSWVQLLDIGNLKLSAGSLQLPLRVQLVPAVIDATRGVRYDAAVDHGRNFLAAGTLTVAATGGDGVAAFAAAIGVPRPVRISYIGDAAVRGGTVQGPVAEEALRLRWGSVDGSADLELRIGSEAPGQLGWLRCRLHDDGEFIVPKALSDSLPKRQAHRPWSMVLVRRTTAAVAGFAGQPLVLELADGVHVD